MNYAPKMNRRSFIASVAAVGGGFALGFEIPYGPSVVRAQDGPVLVREPPPRLLRLAADQAPELGRALAHPARSLALDAFDERHVAGEHVHSLERRRLVEDRVRVPRRCALGIGYRHGLK